MTKKTSSKKSAPHTASFEASIQELEGLIERMESGDQTLEQSLQDFERGVELIRTSQQALQKAEQKVQILMEKSGTAELQPFSEDDIA